MRGWSRESRECGVELLRRERRLLRSEKYRKSKYDTLGIPIHSDDRGWKNIDWCMRIPYSLTEAQLHAVQLYGNS